MSIAIDRGRTSSPFPTRQNISPARQTSSYSAGLHAHSEHALGRWRRQISAVGIQCGSNSGLGVVDTPISDRHPQRRHPNAKEKETVRKYRDYSRRRFFQSAVPLTGWLCWQSTANPSLSTFACLQGKYREFALIQAPKAPWCLPFPAQNQSVGSDFPVPGNREFLANNQGTEFGYQRIRDGDQAGRQSESISAEPSEPVEGILERILVIGVIRGDP